MRRIVAVRPYPIAIRARVLALLGQADCALAGDDALPKAADDTTAIAWLRDRCTPRLPDVLLIPFHHHRDQSGQFVDGLTFARRLHDELPALGTIPIVMPASAVVVAGVRLALGPHAARPLSPALRERMLLLSEDELELPATRETVRAHLARTAAPPG
ncbi:MAG: hypothetical protein FJ137_08935 [Deltaproteobacteria bacterium]|nr:hypothetical protein [Deltaproteobacteria bacterium]